MEKNTRGRPVSITTGEQALEVVRRRRETTRRWIQSKKQAGWVRYIIWIPEEARLAVKLAARQARDAAVKEQAQKL